MSCSFRKLHLFCILSFHYVTTSKMYFGRTTEDTMRPLSSSIAYSLKHDKQFSVRQFQYWISNSECILNDRIVERHTWNFFHPHSAFALFTRVSRRRIQAVTFSVNPEMHVCDVHEGIYAACT